MTPDINQVDEIRSWVEQIDRDGITFDGGDGTSANAKAWHADAKMLLAEIDRLKRRNHMSQRIVVVTGTKRGIGKAIAEAFLAEGDYVYKFNRPEVDVRYPITIRTAVEEMMHDHIDVWVNNVGLSWWRPLEDIDEDFWQVMMDTNLKSVLFGCQAAATRIVDGGSIINVSSIAGKRGSANNAVYAATKFGVNGITQSLAKELGVTKKVRVNAVCPAMVRTEGLEVALEDPAAPPTGLSFSQQNSALDRLADASEVADMVVFLASEKASAITGQCINVDCGVFPQ